MAAEVGSAFISIRPSLVGFHKQIAKDLKGLGPQVQKIGVDLGRNLGDGIRKGIGDPISGPLDESTKKQRTKAPKQGEDTAGAFAKGFQKRLKAAFSSLPKAEIDADSSAADKKIAELRGQLEALSNKTVGVDIDAGAALAEIKAIQAELDQVGRSSDSIQVTADVAAAVAELALVQAEVDRLDGRRVRVGVTADTGAALAGIKLVSVSLAGLAAIPVAATVGAGLLSLAGPLAAAGAGFGGLAAVAIPSIGHISDALKAQQQAQAAANGTTAQAKAANEKLAATLKGLSPAERDLLKSTNGLRSAFTDWTRSLQPAVLPVFSRGINLIKQQLPGLTPIVRGAAGAVNGLVTDVGNAAKSPFWVQLRTSITNLVPTSITGFGHILGNAATGLAGVVNAFLPYAPTVLSFLTRITAGFASWGKNLGSSNGFSMFIGYIRTNAPLIIQTVTQIAGAIGHVAQSLAPLSSLAPLAFGGLGLLAKILSGLKPGEIQAIAVGIGLIVAATKLWTIAQLALDFALNANPIGLIVVAVGALIAAVVLAYNHISWFHTAVVAAWNGIKTAALFVWNSVLKPVFTALTVAVQAVATAALWLWHNVLVPAFNAISLAARILFAIVAVAVLAPLVIAFNLLKSVVLALWQYAIVPAFNAIKTAVLAAWAFIKPIFDLWWAGVKLLGSAALWLWHNAIIPAWNGIKTAISTVWNSVIRPVLNAINSVIRNVIAPVFRWIYNSVIKPMWSAAGSAIRTVWSSVISPAFNALKSGVNAVKNAFKTAVDAITKIWHGLESATKKPVQFVVNTVYNNGIRSVWNKVAGLVHLPQLPSVKFATGGIFPGYTPGRDPYQMPMAAFSGGEAVMRPEFTRAVGANFVYTANAIARKRGVSGIRDFLANGELKFAHGGIFPGKTVAAFADGGIIGGILGAVKHAGSLVVHGASTILDAGASAFAKSVLNPILGKIPHPDSTWAQAILGLPKRMIDGFIGWLKTAIDPKLGGDPHGVVQAAKKYVGKGDDRGPNNNMFTRAWGMPGAPWCFAAGTLVDTPQGLVPIEDIKVGDEVLTPSGSNIAVSTLLRREKPLLELVALGVPDTHVTADHPYWTMVRTGPKKDYLEPQWVRAGDLKRGDLIALPVPIEGAEPFDVDLAYVLGMYLADGHRLHRDKGVQFSDDLSETERIVKAIEAAGYVVHVSQNRTCSQFTVYDRGLYELCGAFGDLAGGKRVAGEVFGWSRDAREALLEGYLAGDGSFHERQGWQATTVSRALAIGLGKLVRSLEMVPNVRVVREAQTMVIEGREVQTRTQYAVVWKPWPIEGRHRQFVERDGYLWVPVRSVAETGRTETAYDITVPGEHAFIADGAAVHNCAIFVSTAIKDAHAGKYYPGYPTAAVAGFNGRMRHVPVGSGRAGDLGVYGGGAHINIIEKPASGGYLTIGGNQNALVQRRVRGGQTSMLRPSYAYGGILGRQAQRIFKYEAPRNADPHEKQTPLVRLMRSLPSGQMGSVARAIVKQNLAISNAGVYDNGGVIPPGLSLVMNASRKPEALLSNEQWSQIASGARGGDSYETTYHLYQRDMTVRDLERLQQLQEARQRIGRAR